MIEKQTRPMTAEERAACDPAPVLARQRRADLRSAFAWGVWGVPLLGCGVALFVMDVSRSGSMGWPACLGIVLGIVGMVPFVVCLSRLQDLVTARESSTRRARFEQATVETWTFTVDRIWWKLADEDCDARLMRTTDGRYVFLGTYEWLDIAMGDDESRPMCPSRLRVVDDGVDFSLTALDEPTIALEEVPDELPPEVYSLPHFQVVVFAADELPGPLRTIVEQNGG